MIQTINLANQNVDVNYKKGNNAEISLTTDKDTLIITLDTYDFKSSLDKAVDIFKNYEKKHSEDLLDSYKIALKKTIETNKELKKYIKELEADKEALEQEREEIENKMLKYEAENEDLRDKLEQYEENFQAQLEKTQLSCGLF